MMDDSIINQPTADGISIVLENLGREKSSETVADCVLSTSGTVQVNVFPPHLREMSDDMWLHSSTKDISDPISNTSVSSGGTMASSFFDINIKELFEDMSLASERPSSRSSSMSFEVLKWVADQEQSSNEHKLERLNSFDMEMDAHNIGRIMKKEENRKNIIEKPLPEETNRNERLELENQFLRGIELKIFKEERKKIQKEKVELKREAARKIEQEKKLLEEKWDKVTVNFQKQIEDLRKLLVKERTEKEDLFEKLLKEEENRKNIIEKPLHEETNRNERLELENQFLRGELLRLEKELKIFKEERKKIQKEKVELKREAARKIEQEKKLLEEKWDKVTVNFQKQFEDLRKLLVKERTEKEDLFEKLLKEEKQRTQDNEKQMQQEREKAEKKRQVEEQNLYRELFCLQEERKLFEEERRKFDQEKRLLEERSRLVEELKNQLEKEQHLQEEKKQQQQERRKKQQQEEKRREAEEEKRKKAINEEICRIEVERRRIEEEKRQAEEKKIKEEEIRLLKVEEEWLKSRHKEEMSSLEIKRNDALKHIQPQTTHRNLTSHGSLVKNDSSLDETTDTDHIENAPKEEFQKELNSALSDCLLQNVQSFFEDQSEITVEVFSSEKKVSVVVNGTEAYLNAPSYENARGIHIVILDEAYGSFLTSRVFDTYSTGRDEHMIQFLMDVQDGRILIFAVQDEASNNLRKFARDYLTNLGSKHSNHIRWRDMWVFVATKGGKPLGERLSIKEDRETFAEPAVIKVNISVSQLSVQLPKWHQLVTSCASLVKLTEFALASDEKCVRDTLHRLLTLLAPSKSLNGE